MKTGGLIRREAKTDDTGATKKARRILQRAQGSPEASAGDPRGPAIDNSPPRCGASSVASAHRMIV